jgi:hypothetical protein
MDYQRPNMAFSVLHVRDKGNPHLEVNNVFARLACGAGHEERGVVCCASVRFNMACGVCAVSGCCTRCVCAHSRLRHTLPQNTTFLKTHSSYKQTHSSYKHTLPTTSYKHIVRVSLLSTPPPLAHALRHKHRRAPPTPHLNTRAHTDTIGGDERDVTGVEAAGGIEASASHVRIQREADHLVGGPWLEAVRGPQSARMHLCKVVGVHFLVGRTREQEGAIERRRQARHRGTVTPQDRLEPAREPAREDAHARWHRLGTAPVHRETLL